MNKVTENFQLYLKATESAAIAAAKLRGNGDGKAADKVATEAMRKVLQDSEIFFCNAFAARDKFSSTELSRAT